jgi:serine/threonine protein phosphatase PrpC
LCVERGGNAWCFVVADGLGGHGKGEVASQMLVSTFETVFEEEAGISKSAEPLEFSNHSEFSEQSESAGSSMFSEHEGNTWTESFLRTAFDSAQQRIMTAQKASHAHCDMKTTGVAFVIADGKCRYGHVGDSRFYLFDRNGKFKERTLDHSVPQMLVLAGDIRAKDISRHPDRNRLLRVAGMEWDTPRYELSDEFDLAVCGAVLLCSDGFWEWIDEKDMRKYYKKSGSADDWLDKMSAHVEARAAKVGAVMDNYSAIAVFCGR